MNRSMWIVALAFAPTLAGAQVAGEAQASGRTSVRAPDVSMNAKASATAKTELRVPKGFSAEGKAKLEAMYGDARAHELPPDAISHRVAEGEVKGASEATILASAGRVKANMEASQQAMVRGGRAHPTPEECERAGSVMERGVTSVQIETMTRRTPSDRSLVVAFDVLGRLAANGMPVTQALAQVQAKIDGRASDAALVALAGKATTGGAAGGGVNAGANAAAGVTAVVNGAAGTTGKTTATTGVAGSVTGVLKKP